MPNQESSPENPLLPTLTMIEHAEFLLGLSFTDDEREQMLQALNRRLAHYQNLRAASLENDLPMSLLFDPRVVQPAKPAQSPRHYAMSAPPKYVRPQDLESLAFAPITQLSELIRTRQVTSVELTQMYLGRLKKYDPYLQCVVTLTEDLAMRQAERADQETARGINRGPLHGIPYGAKDLLAVKGYPTTWGAEPYQDQAFDYDATVIERLEEAGAVLIAKLTLGALAYGDIWHGGKTKNPWNLEEGSSGSSAGSASATAAGLVGFAIGTETYGSIVSPATRCGVTGLRPTFGRVSRHGAMALSWSMDKIGPICRTVEDCALVFTATYGPDGQDRTVADIEFQWQPYLKLENLRVGYVQAAFEEDQPNKTNDDASLVVMRQLFPHLQSVTLPNLDIQPILLMLEAEAAAAFEELTLSNRDDMLTWQDKDAWPNLFRAARFIPAIEYVNASRLRMRLMEEMARMMEGVDVFAVPSFSPALPITNLTGHPCVVVPNGLNEAGSPTSVSFIGGLDKEAETLAVAKAYQDATDFHRQHPPMPFAK